METWKDIKGYEGLYKISSNGNVCSLDRIDSAGRRKLGRLLVACDNGNGYLYVTLCKDCTKKHKYIHRLVAAHFIDNIYNCVEVNHKDENKSNNSADNLEWCTRIENINHGTGVARRKAMTDHKAIANKNKKKVIQCDTTGNKLSVWDSMNSAAAAVGCSASLISGCCSGKYKHGQGFIWKIAES